MTQRGSQQGSLFGFRMPQPRPERIDALHIPVGTKAGDSEAVENEFASERLSTADSPHDVSQNETSPPNFFDDL